MIVTGRESVCFHDVTYGRSHQGRPHSLRLDGYYKLDSIGTKKKERNHKVGWEKMGEWKE